MTLFLVLWFVGDAVKMVPVKTIAEVCAIRRGKESSIVFRVDAVSLGRWTAPDAQMRAVLVECQEPAK